MLFGLIILSGAVLKYNVEGIEGNAVDGSGTEGLENMQRQNF